MNTPLDRSHGAKLCLIVVTSLLVCPGLVRAAELKEARVTQVVKDVKLLPETAAPRPAAVNDPVRNDTAVRTGVESRTELTFTDQTLARLGANTIFSFAEGTRSLELKDGAMLLRVPKNSGGAKINTAAITAAITGTTVMIETHPVTTKTKGGFYKFIVLEGTARLFLPGHLGESVLVHAGQMIIMRPDGKKIPNPADVDISKIMQSSLLITGFAPLPSASLIALQEQQQNTLKSSGQLYDTNLVIFGGGTGVSLTDPTNTNAVSVATTAQSSSSSSPPPPTPPPTPSKFGAPVVIASPNPFVISSGTTIQTDPAITTNGQTNFGKIWRGTATDGPLSAFLFGSNSAFDTAIGLDAGAEKVGNSGAVFKFASLELAGNPTVSTTNGQTVLALVGVNGITSGRPGGTLTFAGISTLLLATQNGSINLGPEITFSGFQQLVFYARGAGSNLTLASPVSATIHLNLFAEGSILVSSVDATLTAQRIKLLAGDSITLDGGVMSATATNSSGNVDIIAGSDISVTNGLEIDRKFGGQASGLNVSLSAGTDFTLGSSLVVYVDNSITGNLGTGGNISVTTGGNLTAGSIDAFINNRNGGSIGSGANMTFSIGGALKTTGDASFLISNRFDVAAGGTIGSDATVSLNAASVSIGGVLGPTISNRGATIGGSATIALMIAGDLEATSGTGPIQIGGIGITNGVIQGSAGGIIRSDAAVEIKAANISAPGMPFDAGIDNNNVNPGTGIRGPAGGSIGRDATVNVNAANLDAGYLGFGIFNDNGGAQGTVGGVIGNDATINVNATNINVNAANIPRGGDLDVEIDNTGGRIGGNASINMNVSGTATVATDATVQILGSDGAAAAAINFNGGTYNVGGTFDGFMDGDGTMTFNNATINADTVKAGVFGTNGTLRIGGGGISANTLLHLYAPGSNGLIDFVSNVTLNSVGTAAVIAANTVTVENGVVVTIAGSTPANVYANVPNYTGSGGNGSTRGTFGGAGATTQPLGGQPPFVVAAATTRSANKASASSSSGGGRKGSTIHVSDTSELASLLDRAAPGGDGKARIPSDSRNRNASVQPKARNAALTSNPVRTTDARFAALAPHAQ